MTMADEKVSALEARIDDLESQLEKLREQLVRAQLDQWAGRIEDLEVQLHLGTLELRDRLTPVVDELRNAWNATRTQVTSTSSSAGEALDTVRSGLEKAMADIRQAVTDATRGSGT
jgi:chaperonin cofactor prefoldin